MATPTCSICNEYNSKGTIKLTLDNLNGECTQKPCGGVGRVLTNITYKGKQYPVCEFCRDPYCFKCSKENLEVCQVCIEGYSLQPKLGCVQEQSISAIALIAVIFTIATAGLSALLILIVIAYNTLRSWSPPSKRRQKRSLTDDGRIKREATGSDFLCFLSLNVFF